MDGQQAVYLVGTTQEQPPVRTIRAGRLSCDLSAGELRSIRWCGVEVLRGIAYLFRDESWGTAPSVVQDLVVHEGIEAFHVRFLLQIDLPDGRLAADANIHGRDDGSLQFIVNSACEVDLLTNRCGFVVLHPAAAAGRELRVEHTTGQWSLTQFPLEICPSQPVFDIRGLSYVPVDGVQITVRCEAQLPDDPAGKFEMEDQRNWSDASFKTYVGSLLDPWPYRLPSRRVLRQSIHVELRGEPRHASAPRQDEGLVSFGARMKVRMPAIGVGISPGIHKARSREGSALLELGAAWWIVEADLRNESLLADLQVVQGLRGESGACVQLDVIAADEASPQKAAAEIGAICRMAGLHADAIRMLPAAYLMSYQPDGQWPMLASLEEYAIALRAEFPGALIGGGMYTSFTELNRKRQSAHGLDFIGHLTCPIVHAADDRSVMQTIESLPYIARTVRGLWPNLGYRLGPSSIAARRNPYGKGVFPNPRGERVPLAEADPRHGVQFGAAWVVAYAAAVAPFGLDVLALHDAHGPRGPVPGGSGSSQSADVIPAWNVQRILARAKGEWLVNLRGLPTGVAGIAWTHGGERVRGMIANVGEHPIVMRWKDAVEIAGVAQRETKLGPYQSAVFELTGDATRL